MKISEMPNLGPQLERRLAQVGIADDADLRRVWAVGAWHRLRFEIGRGVTLNALLPWRPRCSMRSAEIRRPAGAGARMAVLPRRTGWSSAMSLVSRRALLSALPTLLLPRAVLAAPVPTPWATEGPFYPTEIPADDDSDLVRMAGVVREAGGDILHLTGRVLDRSARRLEGIRVEIWQCDANGVYLHPGSRGSDHRDVAFQGFGHAVSKPDGAFAFRTIVPVPYPGRTPHIHLKALRNGEELLTTQLYRAGFPQNASDRLFSRLSPDEQRSVSMELSPRADAVRRSFDTRIDLVLEV
jgi:protocatechuate 3,4-dioxygenase beta subunit